MHLALLLFQSSPIDPEQARKIALAFFAILPIIILVCLIIVIVPFWFICKKAGFSPWLSFLCLIPSFGMLILLYVLAFADWKVAPAGPPQLGYPYPPPPPQV